MEDASMPDASVIETTDFSDGALQWLQANKQNIEDIARKHNMYNLEEWEEFERWAYNQSDKLEAARIQQQIMMARIAIMEQGKTFSSVHQDYRTGMIAIERFVCNATRDDEWTLLPIRDEELIMDRLDKLVGRMARMEKWRMGEQR